eukprot:TRINITY_DN13361_c0_g1_i1.p1 TRINITY_DN13361_c0_g1~~TRINITY_DN13361_c0_g1_i1.p1  ORF type:complete len:149 (-),score=19.25 TRINITY_DN13361_c0_g1_i1:26-424(-)
MYDAKTSAESIDPFPDSLEQAWPHVVAGLRAMSAVRRLSFASADDARNWLSNTHRKDRWVLCFGDETELARLCKHRPGDVGTRTICDSSLRAMAGKLVFVDSITANGNLRVKADMTQDTVKMPYHAVLRPMH